MRYLALLLSLTLVGCSTAPVIMKFPEAPDALMEKCEDLDKIPQTKQLSVTAETVIKNYSKYHNCKLKVDEWQNWYKSNKKIFESVK